MRSDSSGLTDRIEPWAAVDASLPAVAPTNRLGVTIDRNAVPLSSSPLASFWQPAAGVAVAAPGTFAGSIIPAMAGEGIAARAEHIGFRVGEALRERVAQRLLEILPGATAILIITSLIWGTFVMPFGLAVLLIAFDVYWFWRSVNTAIHVVRGRSVLKREEKIDWRARYDEAKAQGKAFLNWEDIRHIVVIPSYKETVEKLSPTLETLAAQSVGGHHLFVVLALEEAEEGAEEKARALQAKYGNRFAGFFATFHPANIRGEVRGKSSNEAWAARHIKVKLVDEMGYDIEHLTITSCDADTQFHRNYYACLSHKFATNPERYRRFWQAPIFLYNNIWEVPAPLRLPNSLGGLHHLVRLSRKYNVRFPQSTYSLSLKMADDVGYWDVDVIPEDWHMFLKCFFECGGEVDVEPIFLPLGNDGVRNSGYFQTFLAHYDQARRHCWGAVDFSYAVRACFAHPEIPLLRRLRRTWSVFETHVLWSSQWFLITVGSLVVGKIVPVLAMLVVGVGTMPEWFTPVSAKILFPCLGPLIVLVIMDTAMRPKRPPEFSIWLLPVQYVQWLLMAVITFAFSALPALDAQIRLMLGKRLEYRVTEKA